MNRRSSPRCHFPGCRRRATRKVAFRLPYVLAPGVEGPLGEPWRIETGVAVCRGHERDVKIDEMLTDERWATIVDAIRAQGCESPARSAAELILISAKDGP